MPCSTITKTFYLAVYRCVLSDSIQLSQCYSFIKQIEIGNNLLCCYNAPLPLGKGKCATHKMLSFIVLFGKNVSIILLKSQCVSVELMSEIQW